MQVRVLGDLEVLVDDVPLELGGPKPRALLALLVVGEGRPVSIEHLIDQIWGDEPPERVEASLQSYVARLRRVLEPARDARAAARVLRTHPGGYSLDLPPDAVDARRFTALLGRGRDRAAPDPGAAEGLLGKALDLWRGDAFAGLPGSALAAEAVRLDELRAGALEDLWELRVRAGRHPEAVAELEHLVTLHPLRERLWALLARALYGAHRQGDALAALRRARDHLADELGVDPGPELRRVEELVLRQDPELDAPAPPPARALAASAATPGSAGAPTPPTPPTPPAPSASPVASAAPAVPAAPVLLAAPARTTPPTVPDTEPLVGRDGVLDDLTAVLGEAAGQGRGRLVLVTGEPGIGKTSLLRALAGRAAALGMRCGAGTWETEAVPALWGWTHAVGEALGAADVLVAATGDDVDAASVSVRQADALVATLQGGQATLLLLDDVHWADADSLRLLLRVAARVRSVPLVVVAGLRSSEADHGPAVASMLAGLARLDPVRVELGGLDVAAVTDWVAGRAGVEVGAEVAAALVDRSGGNPLYVGELVRLLVGHGALGSLDAPAWRTVPDNVRDLVRHRTAGLPTGSAHVLRTAAVAGRVFDLLVVERACGEDGATVDEAVESALVLGLVEADDVGRYRFTHALVRDALYAMVPPPTRARTHAAVATALEDRYAGAVGAHVSELAEHYRLAGPALARSAWLFATRAAEAAAAQSAWDEALRLHDLAATLQESDAAATPVEREGVLLGRSAALLRLGHPIQAWPVVSEAARSALARGDVDAAATALISITLGSVWGWRQTSEYDEDAVALWERVLDLLPADREATRAHVRAAVAAELLYVPGAAGRATALADTAVSTVRRCGASPAQRLHVLRLALQAMPRPDLLHHRAALHDEFVELADAVGDTSALSTGLTGRASDRVDLGRLAEGREDIARADAIARRHRLPQNVVIAGWARATLHQLDGDEAAAEAVIAETAALDATLSMAGHGIPLYKRSILRLIDGRLPELEPELRAAASSPLFRDMHALALVEAGRHDEARTLLGPWSEQPPVPWNYLWVIFTVVRARLWCRLGDPDAVAALRADLTPFADRFATGSVAVAFLGSVELALAELAATAGERDAATEHLAHARRVHEELGLDLWVRLTDELGDRLGLSGGG
ncbi:hypothetical protein GCM10023168_01720 [Fodinibacter luteus]|uniref:OmpR/PhoB-type domain-containing protein n=1 Tax=Fodinibacter luteus TaxID=552064 RepID=A0ABP8JWJ0_9MICO